MPHRPLSPRPSSFVDQDARCAHAWQWPKGCAATLRPAMGGVLRVAQGRIWATRDVLPGSAVADLGDHVLGPGDTLVLQAGQGAVIESWPLDGAVSVSMLWVPTAHAPAATRWQAAVAAPARDVGHRPWPRLRRPLGACWWGWPGTPNCGPPAGAKCCRAWSPMRPECAGGFTSLL